MDLLDAINPRFAAWLAEQDPAVWADIMMKFHETASHQDIDQGSRSGHHARQRRTIDYAAERHGYVR